jgi:hypothetical protein
VTPDSEAYDRAVRGVLDAAHHWRVHRHAGSELALIQYTEGVAAGLDDEEEEA